MKLAKIRLPDGGQHIAIVEDGRFRLLDLTRSQGVASLADILHSPNPPALAESLIDPNAAPVSADEATVLAPIDRQEVWAAGVTYQRSQKARMEESEAGASHYDRVYTADRPELFFKATPNRVVGPGEPVRARADSLWSVPEPELTLIVSPDGRLVGFTVGNDMSARDIEGENPLYLPQAKLYRQCCGVGPCVLIPGDSLERTAETKIILAIERNGDRAFREETDLGQMARGFEDLVHWLGRENDFPDGAVLLTGTGIIPPDEFTLQDGDTVSIEITGIGTLTNPVVQSLNAG